MGKVAAVEREIPARMRGFWSHGTSHQAGVGLLVKQAFLDKLNPVRSDDWEEVEVGRAAVLRLRGPNGGIDFFVTYLASGDNESIARASTIRTVAAAIRPRKETLTVLAGDFNFVPSEKDRISKSTGEWSGTKDEKDEIECSRSIPLPYQMHELEQRHFTCDTALARSRLDRVYINANV